MSDGDREASRKSFGALSWRGLVFFGFGAALALLSLFGGFVQADRLLGDLNFSLWSRPAARDLVLVEIDSSSLRKLNSWPWSRAFHSALIQRLSQAGADTVAFDIDFSAQSSPSADAALAQAIAQSTSRIVLASFAQPDATAPTGYRTNLPLPMFRDHAAVALVNIVADEDGKPRHYRLIEDRMAGDPQTMAAALAGPDAAQPNRFLIDYSIDPASVTRISYVDVLTGRFDAAAVAGKKVLVGATAFELGDRFAVPRHGILSGVEIQALAYSSLATQRALHPAHVAWVFLGLAALALAGTWFEGSRPRRAYVVAGVAAAAMLGLGFVLQNVFAVSLSIAPWLAALAAWSLLTLIRTARRHARIALLHRGLALRQKALMEGMFNDSSDGILIADDAGRILMANGAAGCLLEATGSALVGQTIGAVIGGLVLEPRTAAELNLQTASGRTLGLTASVSRSQPNDDEPGVWIVTIRDESAKRAMEAARDATIRELQAATAAKNEFLARISHELRTPLSAIIGFSTMIGDQSLGPIGNGKYVEYARDIHSGGKRLLELVNDIIDITRIEAEQYEIRPDAFELRGLLGGACIAAREADFCGEKTLRFEMMPGAEAMHSDRQALSKVISKLLSNAIKFTGPGGNIVLRAAVGADATAVIEVIDDGPGIPPAALEHAMQVFSQLRGGLDRRHEGSGLGLYLAHRLMTLLDGRLEIDSKPGQGTTVRLILPGALIANSQAA